MRAILLKATSIFALFITFFASTSHAQGILDQLFSSSKAITAEITLINNCSVKSDYFVVRDLNSGAYAKFVRDKATIETKSGSPIQLQLSPSVKDVYYEGVAISARKKMKITADCSTRSLDSVNATTKNPFVKNGD